MSLFFQHSLSATKSQKNNPLHVVMSVPLSLIIHSCKDDAGWTAFDDAGRSFSGLYLGVIRPQHDPATEAVPHVNGGGTAAEADHVGKRSSEGHDQDLSDAERAREGARCHRWTLHGNNQGERDQLHLCACLYFTYIVFLKEAEVADDSHPHQQSGGSQQDPAHVV